MSNIPAHPKAPLSRTDPNRVALALKEEQKKNKELEERIQKEIESKSVSLDSDMATDMYNIMETAEGATDFMKLFWAQQKEA